MSERSRSRAETAAEQISELAHSATPGARLGSRAELRELCGVSLGTLHEALRLLQSTGEILVRTGPGGGIFAGQSSALSDLVRSVHAHGPVATDFSQVARVIDVLSPLIIEDAVAAIDAPSAERLRERLNSLVKAGTGELRDVARASLEMFASIVSVPPPGILKTIAGSVLRLQLDSLAAISGPVDPLWRESVDRHVAAVSAMVTAIIDGDPQAALRARSVPEFLELFGALAAAHANVFQPPTDEEPPTRSARH